MIKAKLMALLIIAPKGVVGTWYNNELPTHLPSHIAQCDSHCIVEIKH
jgi:hypothetical protein